MEINSQSLKRVLFLEAVTEEDGRSPLALWEDKTGLSFQRQMP